MLFYLAQNRGRWYMYRAYVSVYFLYILCIYIWFLLLPFGVIKNNKKHLKNVGPIRHCEPPHALILHYHSPGVATVARRLRIDVHDDDDDNNDNAWQRGPLWPHGMGPIIWLPVVYTTEAFKRCGTSEASTPCSQKPVGASSFNLFRSRWLFIQHQTLFAVFELLSTYKLCLPVQQLRFVNKAWSCGRVSNNDKHICIARGVVR